MHRLQSTCDYCSSHEIKQLRHGDIGVQSVVIRRKFQADFGASSVTFRSRVMGKHVSDDMTLLS